MIALPKAAHDFVEKLRQALPRRPTEPESQNDDYDLRFSIAAIHYEQGHIGEAIIELKSALAANAQHADAHFLLGRIREDQDDCQAAEHEYRQAIRLEPDRLNYHLRLGAILEKKGKMKAALKEYRISDGPVPGRCGGPLPAGCRPGRLRAAGRRHRRVPGSTADRPGA